MDIEIERKRNILGAQTCLLSDNRRHIGDRTAPRLAAERSRPRTPRSDAPVLPSIRSKCPRATNFHQKDSDTLTPFKRRFSYGLNSMLSHKFNFKNLNSVPNTSSEIKEITEEGCVEAGLWERAGIWAELQEAEKVPPPACRPILTPRIPEASLVSLETYHM